jgi:hypothetical protein
MSKEKKGRLLTGYPRGRKGKKDATKNKRVQAAIEVFLTKHHIEGSNSICECGRMWQDKCIKEGNPDDQRSESTFLRIAREMRKASSARIAATIDEASKVALGHLVDGVVVDPLLIADAVEADKLKSLSPADLAGVTIRRKKGSPPEIKTSSVQCAAAILKHSQGSSEGYMEVVKVLEGDRIGLKMIQEGIDPNKVLRERAPFIYRESVEVAIEIALELAWKKWKRGKMDEEKAKEITAEAMAAYEATKAPER